MHYGRVVVAATMKVHQDFFSYRGGVYHNSGYGDQQHTGYHSVRIIGWGEDYSQSEPLKYWVRQTALCNIFYYSCILPILLVHVLLPNSDTPTVLSNYLSYLLTSSVAQQPLKRFDHPLLRVSLSNSTYTYFLLEVVLFQSILFSPIC